MTYYATTTMTSKGQITLPAPFRKLHQIEPGTRITLLQQKGRLVIQPPINVEDLRRRTREHMAKAKKTVPTKAEIEQAKTAYYRQKYSAK